MIKLKFFLNPIERLQPWLNDIAHQGYRLTAVRNFLYSFEKTDRPPHYLTQYLGAKSHREQREYRDFLAAAERRVFFAPINLANINLGKVRFRPYAEGSGKLAGANFNREILILESNTPEEQILTSPADKAAAYQQLVKTYAYGGLLLSLSLALLVFKTIQKEPWLHEWTGLLYLASGILLGLAAFYLRLAYSFYKRRQFFQSQANISEG